MQIKQASVNYIIQGESVMNRAHEQEVKAREQKNI